MIPVIIESPYADHIKRNIIYARKCVRDSLLRGESPIASHLLYTQEGVLNDDIPEERLLGINAGLRWKEFAQKHIFYIDYGMSKGMEYALLYSKENKIPIEYRRIYTDIDLQKEKEKIQDINIYRNKIIHTKGKYDNLNIMRTLPDNSVIILTDPPYGIKYGEQLLGKGDGYGGADRFGWKIYNADWDTDRPTEEYFKEMLRIAKGWIIWGANYFIDFLPPSQCWLTWNKMQRGFSLADCEYAATSFDKASRIFDYSRATFMHDEPFRKHATQKPLSLFCWCIKQAVDYLKLPEHTLFCDPFAGSCTTVEACLEMKMDYLCMEMEEENIKISEERIKNWKAQLKLF
jgi:DNA modification methylase